PARRRQDADRRGAEGGARLGGRNIPAEIDFRAGNPAVADGQDLGVADAGAVGLLVLVGDEDGVADALKPDEVRRRPRRAVRPAALEIAGGVELEVERTGEAKIVREQRGERRAVGCRVGEVAGAGDFRWIVWHGWALGWSSRQLTGGVRVPPGEGWAGDARSTSSAWRRPPRESGGFGMGSSFRPQINARPTNRPTPTAVIPGLDPGIQTT